jgi:hypothetical protein
MATNAESTNWQSPFDGPMATLHQGPELHNSLGQTPIFQLKDTPARQSQSSRSRSFECRNRPGDTLEPASAATIVMSGSIPRGTLSQAIGSLGLSLMTPVQMDRPTAVVFPTQSGGWLRLLSFLVVSVLGSSITFAIVLASATVVVAGSEPAQTRDEAVNPAVVGESFTGVITDARCAARRAAYKPDASECARECVRSGSQYSIVSGETNYQVAGNLDHFDDLAGQHVTVVGRLDGSTINVISVRSQEEE